MPSSGSTNQHVSARSPPTSSPKTGSPVSRSSTSRTATSLARSAAVTQSPGAFSRTSGGEPKWARDDLAPARAARVGRDQQTRRGRGRSCDRSAGIERVGERAGRRGDELTAHASDWRSRDRHRPRRAPPRPLRRTRGSRRDSPTARGTRRRRSSRRGRRPRRRTTCSAAQPNDRNCFHGNERPSGPVTAITASSTRCTSDARTRTPSRCVPSPRTAVVVVPLAWLATSAASAPSPSSAQIEVAQ